MPVLINYTLTHQIPTQLSEMSIVWVSWLPRFFVNSRRWSERFAVSGEKSCGFVWFRIPKRWAVWVTFLINPAWLFAARFRLVHTFHSTCEGGESRPWGACCFSSAFGGLTHRTRPAGVSHRRVAHTWFSCSTEGLGYLGCFRAVWMKIGLVAPKGIRDRGTIKNARPNYITPRKNIYKQKNNVPPWLARGSTCEIPRTRAARGSGRAVQRAPEVDGLRRWRNTNWGFLWHLGFFSFEFLNVAVSLHPLRLYIKQDDLHANANHQRSQQRSQDFADLFGKRISKRKHLNLTVAQTVWVKNFNSFSVPFEHLLEHWLRGAWGTNWLWCGWFGAWQTSQSLWSIGPPKVKEQETLLRNQLTPEIWISKFGASQVLTIFHVVLQRYSMFDPHFMILLPESNYTCSSGFEAMRKESIGWYTKMSTLPN